MVMSFALGIGFLFITGGVFATGFIVVTGGVVTTGFVVSQAPHTGEVGIVGVETHHVGIPVLHTGAGLGVRVLTVLLVAPVQPIIACPHPLLAFLVTTSGKPIILFVCVVIAIVYKLLLNHYFRYSYV